jgi:hypothetical protein
VDRAEQYDSVVCEPREGFVIKDGAEILNVE